MPAEHTLKAIVTRALPRILRLAGLMLAVLVAGLITAPAEGQVEPIEAKWMIVTRTTPMRCGDGATFYKVTDLKRGQVVRMDARDMRFGRIIYPVGQVAFVAKNDASLISETMLRLASETSKVRSPNAISGLAGSWRSLYLGEIQPDAKLEIVGTVEAAGGQVTGYRIAPPHPPIAPHPPYGYAELAAMRDATPDEVQAHLAALNTPAEVQPEAQAEPEPGPGPAAEAEDAVLSDEPEPEAEGEVDPTPDTSADADTGLLDDMVLPGDEPEVEAEAAEQPEAGSTDQQATTTEETDTPTPAPRDWLIWNELESELKRVRGEGRETLEGSLEELIAEYERSLEHAETEPMRHALAVRLDWLTLRKAARDQRLALDAAIEQAEQLRSGATSRIRTWKSGRYDIVGRLVPSAVYDGRRLPRMYRVRAAGETGLVRTIGYVRDVPSLELESKIGRVVGVVGQTRIDRALHLRVITPVRIDTLEARNEPAAETEG